jgi:alpha-glucosidase
MQWENTEQAGFTKRKPWLRIDKNYPRVNVQLEKSDPYSMLSFYKKLIDTRKSEPSLAVGQYQPVAGDQQVMAYIREESGHNRFMVVLNFSHRPAYFTPKSNYKGKIIVATSTEWEGTTIEPTIILGGDEAILVRLE